MNNRFYRNVDKVRRHKKMTHQSLAEVSGISRQTISRVIGLKSEKSSNLKLNNALLLSKALNVDFTSLFSCLDDSDLDSLDPYVDENYLLIFRDNVEKVRPKRWTGRDIFVKKSTVSQILTAKVLNPYLSSLTDIAEALDVDIRQLFKREGDKNDIRTIRR